MSKVDLVENLLERIFNILILIPNFNFKLFCTLLIYIFHCWKPVVYPSSSNLFIQSRGKIDARAGLVPRAHVREKTQLRLSWGNFVIGVVRRQRGKTALGLGNAGKRGGCESKSWLSWNNISYGPFHYQNILIFKFSSSASSALCKSFVQGTYIDIMYSDMYFNIYTYIMLNRNI